MLFFDFDRIASQNIVTKAKGTLIWGNYKLHWSLDVTFSEDDCRIRDEHAAVNFSWMRKFALDLLKNEPSFKASISR